MSRLKLLITNIGFFGGLKVLSSLFPLFILPYVTSKLGGTDEFGIYDIFIVISGLGASIAMLGTQDAMFRQYHINNEFEFRKSVTNTGFIVVLVSSILVGVFLLLINSFMQNFFLKEVQYNSLFLFAAAYIVSQNVMNISLHPSRLENNKLHLFVNTLLYVLFFYATVLLLLQYSFGLFALVYAHLFAALSLASIFIVINRKNFFPLNFSKKVALDLLKIGLPLMPIFLIYWANNSISRMLILNYLGPGELGVFAIGSKYASVSSFLQTAFAAGWSFFTFSTMKDDDQVMIKSKVFETLLFIIVIFYALLAPIAPWFFDNFFKGDYVLGYTVFGQLFLAPLFLILYQIIANQFTIIGKSYYSLISLGLGFLVGLIIALFFLERGFGIVAVSYSIPISYLITIFISYLFAKKQAIFRIKLVSLISFGFIIFINAIIQFEKSILAYFYLFPLIIIFLIINKNLIFELFNLSKRMISLKF